MLQDPMTERKRTNNVPNFSLDPPDLLGLSPYFNKCLFFSFKYRCFGAIKKLMRKKLADVSTILEPAARLKL